MNSNDINDEFCREKLALKENILSILGNNTRSLFLNVVRACVLKTEIIIDCTLLIVQILPSKLLYVLKMLKLNFA